MAATALSVGLKLTIAGCFGLFNWLAWGWITDKFYVDLEKLYATWGIYYPYSGGRRSGGAGHIHHPPAVWSLPHDWLWLSGALGAAITAITAGDLGIKAPDAYDTAMVAFTWLPVLLAAWCTFVLRALPQGAGGGGWLALMREVPSIEFNNVCHMIM